MRRIIVVVNFIFVILIIGNVCSFRRSGQVYQYAQKQLRTIIEGVARNGGEEQKRETTQLNTKARSSPLLVALMQKSVNMKTLSNLIESGADINQPDSLGFTPLMIAISLGRLEIARTLLELGADVHAVNSEGNSALHLACLKGDCLNILTEIIQRGVDINQRGNKGYTPLMIAAEEGFLETLNTLLDLGADVHAVALHMACWKGFSNIVAKLLSSGADINQRGNHDYTPLMFAIQGGHLEIANTLLELGADIHAVGTQSRSALHIACFEGVSNMVTKLVSSGADINQRDNEDDTPLMFAAARGHLETVSTLLDLGADLHAVNMGGNSALHTACSKGFSKIVAKLLSSGADINQRGNNDYTPLMIATNGGHFDIANTLLELGADIHAVDTQSQSALHVACFQGDFPKVIAKLVNSGADINQQNALGGTPLMIAVDQGFSQSVIKLLDLGAKVDILSVDGGSALDMARSNGHTYIAKRIEKAARQKLPKVIATTNGTASRSTEQEPEKEKERDVFLEFYGSTLTLLNSSVRPLSWTQLVFELRSGPTIDAEMEEREQLEDAMMQKAMVAELESDSDSFRNDDQILRPPRASKQDLDEVELDGVVVVEDGDNTHDADTIDSTAIQNIELSKKTLDWWNGALGPYRDMFHMRMRSLMVGRRSYALCKRLQGSDVPIFESKLYGHRILWSLVKRNAATSILVWCVSTHNDVGRRIRLINRSFSRSTYQNASAIDDTAVRWIDVADDEVLLDPFGSAPIKLFAAKADELSVSTTGTAASKKWSPPLLLSAKQKKINAQRRSVLVLGRSGTGKTYYLVNRMQSDARAAAESASASGNKGVGSAFSQLFVTRSARLCELVKYLYRDGDENSSAAKNQQQQQQQQQQQRADFRTLEQFISNMEVVVCGMDRPSRRSFPKNRNVDFAYFRDRIYPRITTSKDCSLDPLTVWTQIRSFFKGSIEAVLLGRPLQLKEYLDLDSFVKNRCRLPKDARRMAFRIFEKYEKELLATDMWDDCDRMLDLLKRCDLNAKDRRPLSGCISDGFGGGTSRNYDRVYVDEVQDCTQAEICLFIVVAGLQFQSLFLVGDPAQAVVEGVDFRFEDLRSIVFQLSQGRELLDRPTTLTANYRSHTGILNYAEKVIDLLDDAFPGSAKKLPTECRAHGPRPAFYMVNATATATATGVDLKDVLAMNERLVVLCRDEFRLQSNASSTLFGIREVKGLEFTDVVLVDFFANIPDCDQKVWKQLLTAARAGVLKQSSWGPQLEAQLKLLYTGSTRSQNRLMFFETRSSVAGLAFFSWLQANQLAEPLQISQDMEQQPIFMTSDEWRARGLDLTLSAEGAAAIPLLREAVKCFEKAKDSKLLQRASAELEFHKKMHSLTETSLLVVQASSSGSSSSSSSSSMAQSEEKEVAGLIKKLVENQLHSSARSLCEAVEPICCDPAKFNRYITSRLVSIIDE